MLFCSLSLTQEQALVLGLRQSFGESSGDIPIYSLHRIQNLIRKHPIDIGETLQNMFLRNVIRANKKYKRDSGNDWSCLTSNNLVDAIEWTDATVKKFINQSRKGQPKELLSHVKFIIKCLHEKREEEILKIRDWFYDNYEKLIYDMDGKIPWGVIQHLRRDLSVWIIGKYHPFLQDIEVMIVEVANKLGVGYEGISAEDAWKLMGGTLFTKNFTKKG